jgi:dCTP diphosphatase
MDINEITNKIKKFSEDRNWDKFHTPKNLTMALSVEVAELVEIFQWLSQEESSNLNEDDLQSVKEELADILIYLIRIADKFNIDLEESVDEKILVNEQKYPIELARGNAVKYNKR